ncbi:MAG: hypothetical protein ACPG4X_16510 [Pikeienuella sp.]
MADENENAGDIDLSTFVPDTFKGEDGAYDTTGFRTKFDEMVATSQQEAERREALPKSPDEYVFGLPEDHALPEGVDLTGMKVRDADGNEVDFDPATIIDASDPDVAVLQGLMHGIAQGEVSPQEAIQKLAGLMVNRELAGMQRSMDAAAEEKKALGPDNGKARIATLTHEISSRIPKASADALMDSLSTADAVRAVEALIKTAAVKPNANPNNAPDYSNMTPRQRISAGLNAR